ncbi:hypothetical protein V495_00273 [Pseudogymnoascus sp. VKM F-4514 (FW-929)]|nr:hypothetical protein V495_00273 [Pseudogymnoascus sp. VKM F-4514 (FW-929)]
MARKSVMEDLDTPDRIRVLRIIDQLRELGVSEDISLPQLVVVGDQSSGKSSLLEGLTDLNFPIASDLCTRHATQIVLHRTPETSVKVSIIPGPSANGNESHKLKLESFAKFLGEKFHAEEFKAILDEAAVHMGLPGPNNDIENLEKRFSDDILKIELSGPNHTNLSVVDVPGLFHNPTKYQTEEDKAIIRGLIERYITDPRTIIMAVLDARNNLANQEVFRMARAADPAGVRTVGIITKCDALQEGDEPGALKIAQNSVERLHHGWFAVKNRSTKEIQDGVTMEQRHINEKKFFDTAPFNQLSKDRVGIPALKKFLGKLLYTHIRGEFPGLVQEIRKLVHTCRDELDALGPSRQTFMEQRHLSGHYDSDLEPEHHLKLRMHIQNANESFGRLIETCGHTRPFNMVDGTVDLSFGPVPFEKHTRNKNIDNWILEQYRQSRGAELPGTVNPGVLESLFRQQSARWGPLAEQHIVKVEEIVRNFNQAVLESLVPEDVLRAKIEARRKTASLGTSGNERSTATSRTVITAATSCILQLRQIIADERSGILQTINHYFADTLANTREERVVGLEDGQYQTIDLAAITRAAHLSNEDQAVNDIHDILKAYYKVALKRYMDNVVLQVEFSSDYQAVNDIHDILKAYYRVALKRYMDNVVLQVIERIYLGSNGPVRAISPEYVGTLSDAELADIAAESYATSSTRTEIGYKLERLDKALNLAETLPI